jgi:hypothetical protein
MGNIFAGVATFVFAAKLVLYQRPFFGCSNFPAWHFDNSSCAWPKNGQSPGSRASWNRSAERGGIQGQAHLILGKRVSWNLAEMGKT